MKLFFNTEAMIKPTQPEHLLAMLREVDSELDNLLENLNAMVAACEASKAHA